MVKDKIFSEIFELFDECHGAMWPDEYHSVILSVFIFKYINCKFEKIYNILIKEAPVFEYDKEEYLTENAVYLYPEYRWSNIVCQENNKLFRFTLSKALRFIEHENSQFINISKEIPSNIDDYFLKSFLIIIDKFESADEYFWFDLYKSYLNIFKDSNHIPESFIEILDSIETSIMND